MQYSEKADEARMNGKEDQAEMYERASREQFNKALTLQQQYDVANFGSVANAEQYRATTDGVNGGNGDNVSMYRELAKDYEYKVAEKEEKAKEKEKKKKEKIARDEAIRQKKKEIAEKSGQ